MVKKRAILCIYFATCLQVSYFFFGFPYSNGPHIHTTPEKVSLFHPLAKFSTIPI